MASMQSSSYATTQSKLYMKSQVDNRDICMYNYVTEFAKMHGSYTRI